MPPLFARVSIRRALLVIAIVSSLVGSVVSVAAARPSQPRNGKKAPATQPISEPTPEPAPTSAPGSMLADDFSGYPIGRWPQSSTMGPWLVQFDGYGSAGVAVDGSNVHVQAPAASTSAGETHAVLTTSVARFGDIDMTLRMRTVEQLRTPAPNAWETAWVFWHYADNLHFYYLTLKPNGWELGKEDPAYPGAQRFLATGSTPYPIGSWNTVRVRQIGTTMTVWANGTLLTTFTDAERPYTAGSIGLYNEDARVHFDDVRVDSP